MTFSRFVAARLSLRNPRSFGRLGILLAVLGVALGVAVMEVALAVVAGFEQSIERQMIGTAGALRVGPYLPFADEAKRPLPLSYALYDSLILAGELSAASAYADQAAIAQQGEGLAGVVLHGVDARWPGGAFASGLRQGRLPQLSADSATGTIEVMISTRLARQLDVSVGGRVRLYVMQSRVRARVATVVGLYQTPLSEVDEATVICPLAVVQRLQGWGAHEVEGYELYADRPIIDLPELASRIDQLVPPDQRVNAIQDLYPEVFAWLGLQHQNVLLLLVLMVGVAVVNLAAALLILITERTHSIGLLKALGATNGQVQRIFLWQAVVLLGLGLLVGNALGLGLIALQNGTGWVQLDPESYLVSTVEMAWVWARFAAANVLVTLVCVLCLLLPVRAVTAVSPVQALRF